MKTIEEKLALLKPNTFSIENTTEKARIADIYSMFGDINLSALFMAHFNVVPNSIHLGNINCKTACKWLLEHCEIKNYYYTKRGVGGNRRVSLHKMYCFIDKDLMVYIDFSSLTIELFFSITDIKKVTELVDEICKFRKKKEVSKISLLSSTKSGIGMRSLEISKPRLTIDDNYNDDFKEVHQIIQKRLSKKNDKGLVLLHGKPGTGKTSYIRYLISSLRKNVIFLPPNMASAITNPDFISVLIDNPNSVFVIEDAENIIIEREVNGASPVSALLNISDGLLADCLNVQIICSFNTDISKVDSALLRKGRLIAKYEFKELEIEKAQQLSRKLGFATAITKPMTLTEIYNQEEKSFQAQSKRTIGFKVTS